MKEKLNEIREVYDKLVAHIPEVAKWTFQEFEEAHILAGSRNFAQHVRGSKTNLIVPFCDMFNHNSMNQADWFFDDNSNGFKMTALIDIKKDQEIFNTYG